jgi:hypothetical protein
MPVAEIHTQRRGPSVWPWIIGLIVLALLVWALAELFAGRGSAVPDHPGTPAAGALLAVHALVAVW